MWVIGNTLKKVFDYDINYKGEVIIPDNIETIEYLAFASLNNLKKITIHNNIKNIDKLAFYCCDNLEEVYIMEGLLKISDGAFSECKNLNNINIPNSVVSIGANVFKNCKNLEYIHLPDSIISIGNNVFLNCEKLKKINLPNKINEIPEAMFQKCMSLKKIIIPHNVVKINKFAFSECINLKHVELSNNLKIIDIFAFIKCFSLKKIDLPESLEILGTGAFYHCKKLKEITIPKKVNELNERVLGNCRELEKITIISDNLLIDANAFKSIDNNNYNNIKEVYSKTINLKLDYSLFNNVISRVNPLINCEYNNNLLKSVELLLNKNIDDFINFLNINKKLLLSNINKDINKLYKNSNINIIFNHILESLSYNNRNINIANCINNILKFNYIYKKTRMCDMIDPVIFDNMNLDLCKKFNLKVYKQFKDNILLTYNNEVKKAFVYLMNTFGIFENDKYVQNRIYMLDKILNKIDYEFRCEYHINNQYVYDKYIYKLKSNIDISQIPDEFKLYLSEELPIYKYKRFKKLSGNFGKRINEFIKDNYQKEIAYYFKISDKFNKKDILNIQLTHDKDGVLNIFNMHRMFDGRNPIFNEKFYYFLIYNFESILNSRKFQAYLNDIQRNFKNIDNYFLSHKGDNIKNIEEAIQYIDDKKFSNIYPEYEQLALDCSRAGVSSNDAFEFYVSIYKNLCKRKKTAVPRYNKIFKFGDNIYKACTLRVDDNLNILIGESNYTNNCQVYDREGQSCMIHASTSNYGGIFVIYKIENNREILLTESWDYVNEQVYIHDNVETTAYFDSNIKTLQKDVIEIYKIHAKELNKISLEAVKNYVKLNPDKLSKKELEEVFTRQVIKLVSVGTNYDDLKISDFLKEDNYDIRRAKDYSIQDYSDAKEQKIIYKNSDILPYDPEYQEKLIYIDERSIKEKDYDTLNIDDLNIIRDIECKAYNNKELMSFQNFLDKDLFLDLVECKSDELKVIIGEDYYMIIIDSENELYIYDFAKCESRVEEEKEVQSKEIIRLINKVAHLSIIRDKNGNIINTKKIRSNMKSDTSYRFYECYQNNEYVNEIFNYKNYFNDNKDLIMHDVCFKVSDKYIKKLINRI